ncbi:DUF4160 domain-containing protein [Pseudoalteromonas sp. S558]|uniref:DUF4160 domain-containing protein n=1 Tax=Pseudoalteromonas sp. S558 TaxID=2066515 RepID=UPI00110AADDF|nr:DUF4160 domain-containing protein [Pseudoalteromonas sp. S558]TMN95148.1 hypothetical protein CWB66_18650 [Pseudoalteromonas sp. S558]
MNPYQLIADKLSNAESLEELTKGLEHLLSGGYSIWEDGELYSIRQLVAKVNGLKIEIYSNEHPPPHFHVKGGDIKASFSIIDCEQLEGKVGRREKALIKWWHSKGKEKLIEIWNSTRPSDCTVGAINT